MEIPRRGLAGAVTATPAASSRSTTPFQLEASAKAPYTSTTVNGAVVGVASVMIDSSGVVTTDGPTGEAAPCTASRDTPRPAAATATAEPATANRPSADRRDRRCTADPATGLSVMMSRFP